MEVYCYYFLINLIVINRLYSIYWHFKEMNNFKSFSNLGILILFKSFFTLTAYGSYLIFYFSSMKVLKYPVSNIYFSNALIIDLTTTMGFWLMVYPFSLNSKEPQNRILDISSHLPSTIIMNYLLFTGNYVIKLNEIIYSVLSGLFWFVFIWGPWYYLTNDPLYFVLDKIHGNFKRVIAILKILLLILINHILLSYLKKN